MSVAGRARSEMSESTLRSIVTLELQCLTYLSGLKVSTLFSAILLGSSLTISAEDSSDNSETLSSQEVV